MSRSKFGIALGRQEGYPVCKKYPTSAGWLVFYWCLTALSAQTGYIMPGYEIYYVGPGYNKENHTIKLKSAQRDTNLRAGSVQPDRTF